MKHKGDIHGYDDILHLPHHQSGSRAHMSLSDRAAQFSPFAALTGHDAALQETERMTEGELELTEDAKRELNEKLLSIMDKLHLKPKVTIIYFVPDKKKKGGAYVTQIGCVKQVDEYERVVIMTDTTRIPMDDICYIESE